MCFLRASEIINYTKIALGFGSFLVVPIEGNHRRGRYVGDFPIGERPKKA